MKFNILFLLLFLTSCATFQPLSITQVNDINPQPIEKSNKNLVFSLLKVYNGIPAGEMMEVQGNGPFCLKMHAFVSEGQKDEGQVTAAMYNDFIKSELEKYNFEVTDFNTDLTLRPVIRKSRLNSCYPNGALDNHKKAKGESYMEIEWTLRDEKNSNEILSFTSRSSDEITNEEGIDDGIKILVENTIRAGVRKLAANDDFRNIITVVAKNPGLEDSPQIEKTNQQLVKTEPKYETLKISQKKNKLQGYERSKWKNGVYTIITDSGHGSGFRISENLIITNHHVIDGFENVAIKQAGEEGFEIFTTGKVIRFNEFRDIALIETKGKFKENYFSVETKLPKQGDDIFVMGTPLELEFESTMTNGVVSAIRKDPELPFIQSEVAIYPGSSGGPMIDLKGKVVGVSVLGHTEADSLNLFIPIESALKSINVEVDAL